jgi:hypothetical protein
MANNPITKIDPDGRAHKAVADFYKEETAVIETKNTNRSSDTDGDGYNDTFESFTQTGVVGYSVEFDGQTYFRKKNENWADVLSRNAVAGGGVIHFGSDRALTYFTPESSEITVDEVRHFQKNKDAFAMRYAELYNKIAQCFQYAERLAYKYGNANPVGRDERVQMLTKAGISADVEKGIKVILYELENSRAVVVGVDLFKDTELSKIDGITDHYITITSYAIVEGKLHFYAVENILNDHPEKAIDQKENYFILHEDNTLRGHTAKFDDVWITHVRPNE